MLLTLKMFIVKPNPLLESITAFNNQLDEHEKNLNEFLEDNGYQLQLSNAFVPCANLSGSRSKLKFNVSSNNTSLDQKASAALAQQYVDSVDFLAQFGEQSPKAREGVDFTVKVNVLNTYSLCISRIAFSFVQLLIKMFTKKKPFMRRRGVRRRSTKLKIKRYRFILSSELLKFFLIWFGEAAFPKSAQQKALKTLVSQIKCLRLYVVLG